MFFPRFVPVFALIFLVGCNAATGKGGKSTEEELLELLKTASPKQLKKVKDAMESLKNAGVDDLVTEDVAPVKKITLKKARSMMRAFRAALTRRGVRKVFEKKNVGNQTIDANETFHKVAPLLDRHVEHILEKYGFKAGPGDGGFWGIQQAVRSATEAGGGKGKTDKGVAMPLEDIHGVIVGTATQAGRLEVLDALAEKFLDMTTTDRTEALKKAEQTSGGEIYAQTMKNIVTQGEQYLLKSYKQAVKEWEDKTDDDEIKSQLRSRLNVIREFLRDDEGKRNGTGEDKRQERGHEL